MKKRKNTKKLTVALAIPTYNREEVLIDTLRSAFALRPAPNEILVVDQTLEHEETTRRYLSALHRKGGVWWICQQPPSVTAARNRLISETESDVIIFIDDDVELPKDFITRHLKNYEDEKVVAVAGGVIQENQPKYPEPPRGGKWPRIFDYKYFSVFKQKRTRGVATFMGCNHSVRVEILKKLGGYDTNYIGSALREETDMAIRIWKAGGLIVFDPRARLTHLVAPSGGCRINNTLRTNPEWSVSFNRNYFSFRHLFFSAEFWRLILFRDFRQSVLRKDNFFHPWKIPWAFLSYYYSVCRAAIMAFRKNREEARRRF